MDDRPIWFAPKRYGYGAGLPVAWQGWAVTALYIVIVLGAAGLAKRPLILASILVPATILFVFVAAKTTRGGMRWRWGGKPD